MKSSIIIKVLGFRKNSHLSQSNMFQPYLVIESWWNSKFKSNLGPISSLSCSRSELHDHDHPYRMNNFLISSSFFSTSNQERKMTLKDCTLFYYKANTGMTNFHRECRFENFSQPNLITSLCMCSVSVFMRFVYILLVCYLAITLHLN